MNSAGVNGMGNTQKMGPSSITPKQQKLCNSFKTFLNVLDNKLKQEILSDMGLKLSDLNVPNSRTASKIEQFFQRQTATEDASQALSDEFVENTEAAVIHFEQLNILQNIEQLKGDQNSPIGIAQANTTAFETAKTIEDLPTDIKNNLKAAILEQYGLPDTAENNALLNDIFNGLKANLHVKISMPDKSRPTTVQLTVGDTSKTFKKVPTSGHQNKCGVHAYVGNSIASTAYKHDNPQKFIRDELNLTALEGKNLIDNPL